MDEEKILEYLCEENSMIRKQFDIAQKEFNTAANEDEKVKLVYAYFGAAIYYIQTIEMTFITMICLDRILKKKPMTNKDINIIIDAVENSKLTMGGFIKEIKDGYNLDDFIIQELNMILKERNYLIHNYFKRNIEKFYSEKGMLEMIKYFCDLSDKIQSLDKKLNKYYESVLNKFRITEEKLSGIINKIIETERQRNG